eukprot:TRINITY_DN20457_c0_g1_i1.p2 TRINITY_DN20457_c0_g1~~TRINITY_DN20457_c0_g1_i1.p2  ORF type:complete len:110 (-),score=19.89 TRINITY_DN20457_c0_g1_i1:120-404(-)
MAQKMQRRRFLCLCGLLLCALLGSFVGDTFMLPGSFQKRLQAPAAAGTVGFLASLPAEAAQSNPEVSPLELGYGAVMMVFLCVTVVVDWVNKDD